MVQEFTYQVLYSLVPNKAYLDMLQQSNKLTRGWEGITHQKLWPKTNYCVWLIRNWIQKPKNVISKLSEWCIKT